MKDYSERMYLSAAEVAVYLGVTPSDVYELVKLGKLKYFRSPSGQYRFRLNDIKKYKDVTRGNRLFGEVNDIVVEEHNRVEVLATTQVIYLKDARSMKDIPDNEIHLVITSPPYFNAKMYSSGIDPRDLGNIHDFETWLLEIKKVYMEIFRVLSPGRKFFLNIMNLPVRTSSGFRTINIVGKTIDICEEIGFIFKREIVWHKTNSVRAHFGTYPYPGGILINFSHEFILEFEKPAPKGYRKYAHLTKQQKEDSKLEKDFWLELKKSDVWTIAPAPSGRSRLHPAPFPEEIPYRLIKAYSFVGEKVLDPFVGIGTTLVAAAKLGRNGVGYEINPIYVRVALQNLKSLKRSG